MLAHGTLSQRASNAFPICIFEWSLEGNVMPLSSAMNCSNPLHGRCHTAMLKVPIPTIAAKTKTVGGSGERDDSDT